MIGDCILITPAITLLKKRFPEAKITVLCRSYTKDVFLNNPDIDQVIEDWFVDCKKKSFWEYVKFIKSHNFDCSIHFYNELPYALLALFAGIKTRVGDISKPLLRPFYNLTSNCRWHDLTLHEVEHNILLLKPLGIGLPKDPIPLKVIPDNDGSFNIKKPYGIIHLGTGKSKSNKAWPAEKFAKVAEYLLKHNKLVVTGSQNEIPAAKKIKALCPDVIDFCGKTSLADLIKIISECSLFVSIDTGILHAAAALNIPTVAIFPTKFFKASEWGPWETKHIIVRKPENCIHRCAPAKCIFDDCYKSIMPEDVIKAAIELCSGFSESPKPYWFKKSANITSNKEEIVRELCINGFHATKLSLPQSIFDLYKTFVREDINIIHWVGGGFLPILIIKLAALLATPKLAIPPLIIHEKQFKNRAINDLIPFYMENFKK